MKVNLEIAPKVIIFGLIPVESAINIESRDGKMGVLGPFINDDLTGVIKQFFVRVISQGQMIQIRHLQSHIHLRNFLIFLKIRSWIGRDVE
jgi:hypothetical protein